MAEICLLGPFCVPGVRLLGVIGKHVRERGLVPRMVGLCGLGAEHFPCLLVKIRRPWRRIFSVALMSAWPDYDLLARIKIMSVSPPFWGILRLFLECGSSEIS